MDVKKTPALAGTTQMVRKNPYGQARGGEPVQYVENIRGYYDLLVWLTEENQIKKNAMEAEKMPEQNQTATVDPKKQTVV